MGPPSSGVRVLLSQKGGKDLGGLEDSPSSIKAGFLDYRKSTPFVFQDTIKINARW